MQFIALSEASFFQLIQFFGPRIVMAVFCGAIVGLERELKNKAAGIKTNILICVGSALYTSVSILISSSFSEDGYFGDPARVAAQIVSGIGFLGGGAIIQSRGTVQGLTTAATIWVVAALGIAIGLGYLFISLSISLLVVSLLVGVTYFETKFIDRAFQFSISIWVDESATSAKQRVNDLLEKHSLELENFDIQSEGNKKKFHLRYFGGRSDHRRFVLDLWGLKGVTEVRLK